MDSRMLLMGIVSLGVVLTLGYFIGRWTGPQPEGEGAGEIPADEEKAAGQVLAKGTTERPDAVALQIAELEGELALHKLRKETLEHELYGDALAWPEDTPEKFEPGWFEANLREAVAACAPDVEIVGVECDEPPCMVLLRGGDDGWWGRLINDCPGWADHYGSRVTSSTGSLDCPGGGEERYNIVAPSTTGWLGDDPEEKENLRKRWAQRSEEARFHWVCADAV